MYLGWTSHTHTPMPKARYSHGELCTCNRRVRLRRLYQRMAMVTENRVPGVDESDTDDAEYGPASIKA